MKVAIIFDNFGPYHLARLRAANQVCSLLAIEINSRSREYAWKPSTARRDFDSVTLDNPPVRRRPAARATSARLARALARFEPDCVFVPGWSRRDALACLRWCLAHRIPAVVMSESTAQDSPRHAFKELVKRRVVALFSSALIGGKPHLEYLAGLGMPRHHIFQGYDVVDNEYFGRTAAAVRVRGALLREKFRLPERYFLASARFIEKKNLGFLLEAFVRYLGAFSLSASQCAAVLPNQAWSLVILGDGPLRLALDQRIRALGLERFVLLPGFKQYAELPIYYRLAGAFVHASTSEPWGLVVNEALASGLPVLVSNRCGCSVDLVRDGLNGFTFDPLNLEQLTTSLFTVSSVDFQRSFAASVSAEIVSAWSPNRFSQGLLAAAREATRSPPPRAPTGARLLLRLLSAR